MAARDAQNRTRYAFIAVTVVAVAIMFVLFNGALSWSRLAPRHPPEEKVQQTITQQWLKSTRITNSLLGIDVGVDDIPIVGSFSLYILAVWFFYSIRRENHLIARLLIDSKTGEDKKFTPEIFHGVCSYLVFTTLTKDDEPIDNVDPKTKLSLIFYLRPTFVALIYLPAITIAFMIIADIVTLYFLSIRTPNISMLENMSPPQWVHFAIRNGIALVAGTTIYHLCTQILRFERATGKILREYHDKYV